MARRTITADFWRGRRVLVTGHTGFKGAWLCLWLNRLGAYVHGLSLEPPTQPNAFSLFGLDGVVSHTIGDIRDRAVVQHQVKHVRPDTVFHLAAQSLVRPSYSDPVGTFETNVLGSLYLLDAIREMDVDTVLVNVTSDKVYENKELGVAFTEDQPFLGADPYSASKGAVELVAHSYAKSFASEITIGNARAGNVIGGGDWAEDRLLPDIIKALASGREPIIRSPFAVRPWQHVLDPLYGYLCLAESLHHQEVKPGEGWNFGPSEEPRTVAQLADAVCAAWDDDAGWIDASDTGGPREATHLSLSCVKAKEQLDWRPKFTFDEAVQWTVDWYRQHYDNRDVHDLALGQIEEFERFLEVSQ